MTNLTEISPDIFRLTVPFEDVYTTVIIFKTPDGDVLFDTATYPSDIDCYVVPALNECGITAESLKYVVISHDHRDHAGGLARFAELYPSTIIAAGSESCAARVPGRTVRVLNDGDMLCGVLRAVSIPGHTLDCTAILDTRSASLITGDCLQMLGLFGSGKWGANISRPVRHLEALGKLRTLDVDTIIASHDYSPCGYLAKGKAAVMQYYSECENALYTIKDTISAYLQLDDAAIAEIYNSSGKLPVIGAHVITAMRKAMDGGKI